jgi:hypothetical protein
MSNRRKTRRRNFRLIIKSVPLLTSSNL